MCAPPALVHRGRKHVLCVMNGVLLRKGIQMLTPGQSRVYATYPTILIRGIGHCGCQTVACPVIYELGYFCRTHKQSPREGDKFEKRNKHERPRDKSRDKNDGKKDRKRSKRRKEGKEKKHKKRKSEVASHQKSSETKGKKSKHKDVKKRASPSHKKRKHSDVDKNERAKPKKAKVFLLVVSCGTTS